MSRGKLIIDILFDAGKWEEGKHPRGQPENAGEFAKAGGAVPKKVSANKKKSAATPSWKSELPLPHPSAPLGPILYDIANEPGKSKAEKIKALEAVYVGFGGPSDKYKSNLIKALKGEPFEESPAPFSAKSTPSSSSNPTTPGLSKVVKPDNPPASWKALMSRARSALKGENNPEVIKAMPSDHESIWMKKVKNSISDAIYNYTEGDSALINNALRNPANALPEALDKAREIDEAFDSPLAKIRSDIMVYRGSELPDEVYIRLKQSLKLGLPTRFSQDGFISTSLRKGFIESWGSLKLEIMVKKETPALSIRHISEHESEDEVLLRHGQAFEVLEIEEIGNKRVIRCATV